MVLNIQTVHHILKNTAVQNVNKPFVYITDLTSPLKGPLSQNQNIGMGITLCRTIITSLSTVHVSALDILT
jgi:hypothetical protein